MPYLYKTFPHYLFNYAIAHCINIKYLIAFINLYTWPLYTRSLHTNIKLQLAALHYLRIMSYKQK